VQAAAALGAQVTDHDSALCSPLSGTFVGWSGDVGSAGQRSHKFSTGLKPQKDCKGPLIDTQQTVVLLLFYNERVSCMICHMWHIMVRDKMIGSE
jgi:hypothetical protein